MQAITERIRQEAHSLFRDNKVDVVLGYRQGWDASVAVPCFITQDSQVEQLVFNEHCVHNLAKYLAGREGYLTSHFRAPDKKPRLAIVARPATLRAIVGLMQEHQFARKDLIVLGIVDGTTVGLEPDVIVGQIGDDHAAHEKTLAQVQELQNLSPEERRTWWESKFSACIRCYACRQICPFCYCERCISDESQPQWIGRSPSPVNNNSWNIIRAYHLVGRCVECGECERVCPVEIPLSLLASKMATEVKEAYGYVPGTDAEAKPALNTFRPNDPDEFIK